MPPRKAELRRRAIKASRTKVSPEEREGKKVVKARSGGLCEACGMRRAAEWHHRKNRSQGGTWDVVNGLHLCLVCHAFVGDKRHAARARGWVVLRNEQPDDVPVLRRDSWVWLRAGGRIEAIENYRGGPWDCPFHLERDRAAGGPLRCGLGVLHDGDHECGLVTWPQTSKELAHG